jgi:hypothetical protein
VHAEFWLGWKTILKQIFYIIGCEGQDWIIPVAGSCEYGNGPSESTKCGKFLDKLSDY